VSGEKQQQQEKYKIKQQLNSGGSSWSGAQARRIAIIAQYYAASATLQAIAQREIKIQMETINQQHCVSKQHPQGFQKQCMQ